MQEETKQNRLQELEALVAREQDRLFRFAYLRVGSRADAEDIVQEVFLKLYRSEERLRRVRQMEHYLLRAVNNACRDFHRKRQYHLIPLDEAVFQPFVEIRGIDGDRQSILHMIGNHPVE